MNSNPTRERRDRDTQSVLDRVNNMPPPPPPASSSQKSTHRITSTVYTAREMSESDKKKYDILKIALCLFTIVAVGLMAWSYSDMTFNRYRMLYVALQSKSQWIPYAAAHALLFMITVTIAVITPLRNVRTCGLYCLLTYTASCILATTVMHMYWVLSKVDVEDMYVDLFAFIHKRAWNYQAVFQQVFTGDSAAIEENMKNIRIIVSTLLKNNSTST